MKKTTAELVQISVVRNRARVIDLLHWSADEYSTFIHNTGLQYLHHYTGTDKGAFDLLNKSKAFWNWFKNGFNERTEAFIAEWDGLEDAIPFTDMEVIFRDMNNPAVLACEIAPPSIVFPANFHVIKQAM